MTLPRVVSPERLDHLAPDDPAALQSRRDLVRIHRAMGTRRIVSRAWTALVSAQRAAAPLRILELGAGDGRLLLGVARSLSACWPRVELTLLDRQPIVTAATLAGFGELGWSAQVQVADVLDWAAAPRGAVPRAPGPRWDLITTTLFLHHFDDNDLGQLLAATASRSDRFFACEPSRSWPARVGSHLVGAIGANAVTREDAVLSVQAGFRDREISALWPPADAGWQLRESAAGLFSHTFSAFRAGVGA